MLINFLISYINPVKADVPHNWGLYFQDSGSPIFEGIVELHDQILFYLIIIFIGVTWILYSILFTYKSSNSPIIYKYTNHGTLIELIWTISPAIVLVAIAFPSFKLLYLMDEVLDPAMTVKVLGRQWYWTYEYSDFNNENNEPLAYDSYLIDDESLELGQLRMLEVDQPMVLPINTHVRFILGSGDVIHDFAVPALGLKLDATPGRLNQTSVMLQREGSFYGQCSELCGIMHSAMPIKIEGVNHENFIHWLNEQTNE